VYGVFHFQRFLIYKGFGLVNTILPILLNGFLPVWMIAAYALYINRPGSKEIENTNDYIKKVVPLSIVIAAIHFAILWGGYMPSLIYIYQQNLFTFPITLYTLITQGTQSIALNLLIFIPIVVIWALAIFLCGIILKEKEKTPEN
jgi:heme/copper-type cytochrome/quinol oxidase subunit 2